LGYKVLWHKDAVKELKQIDKKDASEIIDKVTNYLVKEPFKLGKLLKGNLKMFRRYRLGKYRVIYTVNAKSHTLMVLRIGKRDKIYKSK
jgi:mRNA interferase RelE/StbE